MPEMLFKDDLSVARNRPEELSLVVQIRGDLYLAWAAAGVTHAKIVENSDSVTLIPCGPEAADRITVAPHKGYFELEFRREWLNRLFGTEPFSATTTKAHLSEGGRIRFQRLEAFAAIKAIRQFREKKQATQAKAEDAGRQMSLKLVG